jgi:hypothetical protein
MFSTVDIYGTWTRLFDSLIELEEEARFLVVALDEDDD